VLLAEDHEGLRELGKETLEVLGYKVILAENGTEAVAFSRTILLESMWLSWMWSCRE